MFFVMGTGVDCYGLVAHFWVGCGERRRGSEAGFISGSRERRWREKGVVNSDL